MNADVVIVGGGLSGLALADKLHRAGADYLLLEARDRLGGRILSKEVGGACFDVGPAWFWPGQPRMAALVERLRLETFEQHWAGDSVAEDERGRVLRGAGFASMRGSCRIDGGLGRAIGALGALLPGSRTTLSATVRALTRVSDGVILMVEAGGEQLPIHAGRVVLAVPPRVARESIRFTPELAGRLGQALTSIPTWMAGQAKILAVYDRPYWREGRLSGDAMSRRGPMTEIHDASPRAGGPFAVFGFVGVPPDARRRHPDQIKEMARHQLARLFGDNMLEPLALVLEDWAQDPLTATPLDHLPIGGHPAYGRPSALDGLWDHRLFFAGTEMAFEFGGFLEGALEAAEDVERRLVTAVDHAPLA
jgi:monoamine oxidase